MSGKCQIRKSAGQVVRSLRLDAGSVDDRPPFLDFGLVQGAERFGCLLIARKDFLRKISKARTHVWICQRVDDRGVEIADNLLRRTLRHPHSMPDVKIEAR